MIFWMMFCAHALCDGPLQGDFLARGKNHNKPIPGVPWLWCLLAHSLIHGGAVTLVTGSLALGIAELVAHTLIDFGKSEEIYGFWTDQWLHLVCKIVWMSLLTTGVAHGTVFWMR